MKSPCTERHRCDLFAVGLALAATKVGIGAAELVPPVYLVLVERESRHVGPHESTNVPHGSADAASHDFDVGHGRRVSLSNFRRYDSRRLATAAQLIETLAQIQLAREVKLVPPRGLVEILVRMPVREVEGCAPSPLAEQRGQIVATVHEADVIGVALVGRDLGVEALVFSDGEADVFGLGEITFFLMCVCVSICWRSGGAQQNLKGDEFESKMRRRLNSRHIE